MPSSLMSSFFTCDHITTTVWNRCRFAKTGTQEADETGVLPGLGVA